MIKFPEQYHKVNNELKFKKMVVSIGNLVVDIPLFLPINYKQEYYLKEYYWNYGSKILLGEV